jgi:site-specific DNA-cytosine methylase
MYNFIELFCGCANMSLAFKNLGFNVCSIDYDDNSKANVFCYIEDIIKLPGCDVIWSSSPCECFSKLFSMKKNFNQNKLNDALIIKIPI